MLRKFEIAAKWGILAMVILAIALVLVLPSEKESQAEKPKPVVVSENALQILADLASAPVHLPPPPPMPALPTKPLQATPKPPVDQDLKPLKASPKPAKPEPVITKLLVASKPAPKPALQSKPEPKPEPKPSEPVVRATSDAQRDMVSNGRVMLRLLEHGKGPVIEIAWPKESQSRDRLFATLKRCFGMTLAVMDNRGRLYRAADRAGQSWALNTDRYSGFLRSPVGQLTMAEQRADRSIRSLHGLSMSAAGVRLFPRTVDARLLGGLQVMAGGDPALKHIRARYEQKGSRLFITDISINGRSRPGRIDLGTCR